MANRPKFSPKVREVVWLKTSGQCFHCCKELEFDGDWDVDHYPVVYRDIEDQCYCWPLGTVVDPLEIDNLQPSCVACNRSHEYERKIKAFCGHSQLRIPRTPVRRALIVLLMIGIAFFLGWSGGAGWYSGWFGH